MPEVTKHDPCLTRCKKEMEVYNAKKAAEEEEEEEEDEDDDDDDESD